MWVCMCVGVLGDGLEGHVFCYDNLCYGFYFLTICLTFFKFQCVCLLIPVLNAFDIAPLFFLLLFYFFKINEPVRDD